MSTGRPHPLSSKPATLLFTSKYLYERSYIIQVSCDHVGILVSAQECDNELFVWDWKSGGLRMVCKFPISLLHYAVMVIFSLSQHLEDYLLESFSFVTERHIIVGGFNVQPCIFLLDLFAISNKKANISKMQ